MAEGAPERFLTFTRAEWRALRDATPMTLSDADLAELQGVNEHLDRAEVEEVYLPLCRLLALRIEAAQRLGRATAEFLGHPPPASPFVIGIAGSVAVGKSTTARVLRALLERLPTRPRVDLVATDGFLWPRDRLEACGLLERKGFPESYDRRRLLAFLDAVRSGAAEVRVPVYSHEAYDIVEGRWQTVRAPDVLLVEGLNILHTCPPADGAPASFVSDFLDHAVFVDAAPDDLERWYVERFLLLRSTSFGSDDAYFHRYAGLDDESATAVAAGIWQRINAPNLVENVLPTRGRADLVLEKGPDHRVRRVRLRRS